MPRKADTTDAFPPPKKQKKKQADAVQAEQSVASVAQGVLGDDAPVPEDWAADIIRAVLKWQIEQLKMKPSEDRETANRRARDSRTMTELVRTLEKLDAVEKRASGKAKKIRPRDDKAIKEQFVRKLDQLLAARDQDGVPRKPEPG